MKFRESLKPFFGRMQDQAADEALVQCISAAMSSRLTQKRNQAYGGWLGSACSQASLHQLLAKNLAHGDMIDVINLAGMIHVRGELYGEPTGPNGLIGSDHATRYSKLDADGRDLHDDSREHAFLIDRKAGLVFDVRALHRGSYETCMRFAGETTALGRAWRSITVDEAFLYVADRTKQDPAVDRALFPKFGGDWIWTSTPDAKPSNPASPVFAWGVDLYYGSARIYCRGFEGFALPVSPLAAPASQS